MCLGSQSEGGLQALGEMTELTDTAPREGDSSLRPAEVELSLQWSEGSSLEWEVMLINISEKRWLTLEGGDREL